MATEQKAASGSKVNPTHHFGRGGAGNTTVKDAKSPVVLPEATPTLKTEMYTTGRGGTGNMAKFDPNNPEEARAAQDADEVPEMSLPEGPRTVGRGGAANFHIPTEEERIANQNLNAKKRGESFNKDKLKNLADKGRDLLTGKTKDKNAEESAVDSRA